MPVTGRRSAVEEEVGPRGGELVLPVELAVKLAFTVSPTLGTIILGPPGIGKTELVRQYAEREAARLGREFVDLGAARMRLREEEYDRLVLDIVRRPERYYLFVMLSFGAVMPDELMGVPRLVTVRDGERVLLTVERVVLKESLRLLTLDGVRGVLLLDDALNANDNVRRSFLLAVFQARRVGGFDGPMLSPGVRVIATGNPVSESELAVPLPRPMMGRALVIRAAAPPLERWYAYMEERYRGRWFREVYAFLKRYPDLYVKPELYDAERGTGPVPRSWTLLALALKDCEDWVREALRSEDGARQLMAAVAAVVGDQAAVHFVAFLRKPVISVEEALRDPSRIDEMAGDMDAVLRFAVHLAEVLGQALRSGNTGAAYGCLRALHRLIAATTRDIGEFVLSVLDREERAELKRLLLSAVRSGPPEVREAARELYREVLRSVLADVLLDTAR